MSLDRNLAILVERERLSNTAENRDQLFGFQCCWSSTSEVHGLDLAPFDSFFCGLQLGFHVQGSKECFCSRFPIQFQIEGAKIATLPAEWNVEIEPEAV